MALDVQRDCTCKCEWTDAIGTHDTVTGEWLPDKPTKHVRLIVDPNCPIHRYHYQHKTTPEEFWERQKELGNA